MPGHVLNAGDTAVKRAGVLPALRELTVFEFKASNWIGNRAELLFPDWQRGEVGRKRVRRWRLLATRNVSEQTAASLGSGKGPHAESGG